MTHRVARPMKFAAFISIIVSVAVIFAACQGAVGPKGDKGDPGDPGGTGGQGDKGDPGVSALIATGGVETIRVDDKSTTSGNTITRSLGDKPADFDVSQHFIGGTGDLTFSDGGPVDDQGDADADPYYTVKLDKDTGMVTVSVRDTDATTDGVQPGTAPTTDAGTLVRFVVTATDGNKLTATKTINIVRNVAPTTAGNPGITITDGVGTQNADNPSEEMAVTDLRPRLNQYVLTVMVDDTHFGDGESDSLMIEAESNAPAVASVAVDGQKVIITGHTATGGDDGPEAPTITLNAVDAGGLKSPTAITFTVMVVAAPTADGTIGAQAYDRSTTEIDLVNNIASFFKPATGLTITAKSSDTTRVALPTAEDDHVSGGGHLRGTPSNSGSATITVTATDDIGQFGTQTFTATVNQPSG